MRTESYTLRRSRLTELADRLRAKRILYVQAPAGYGKTVFGSHWLHMHTQPRAMLTLDEYDNTLFGFCYKLRGLLEELCADIPSVLAYTEHPAFDNAPVEFLMRAASALPKAMAANIVIDDLHNITDPAVQKILPVFLTRLPADTRILILSRTAPPESFSGLILKNDLFLIPQEEMCFDSSEIYALYQGNAIKITKEQAEIIFHFTEGWPIVINALLISGVNIPRESLSPSQLETFIKTQMWDVWDEPTRAFLVGTSMEEELTEPLCTALTGRSDSGAVLERLLANGVFLTRQQNGSYRFHNLFRLFLQKQFHGCSKAYQEKQYSLAGNYYLRQKDFYRAIERFSQTEGSDQIACCFDLMEHIERTGFDTERVMLAVKEHVDETVAEKYPFLFYMMAFTARNEGRVEDFKRYADQYYRNQPRVVQRNPERVHNVFFLYAMDFRYTIRDIAEIAAKLPAGSGFQVLRGSAASYFPLYHRSYRDFSELALLDLDAETEKLDRQLGVLLGVERAVLIECVRAGLYYEKGELSRAKAAALAGVSKIRNGFPPKSKFCALVLLLVIEYALEQPQNASLMEKEIQNMIEADKAFYLQFNFDAIVVKHRLSAGDTAAAETWLRDHNTKAYARAEFFRLYELFTTARAHIASGSFDTAIILLQKINELCTAMNRPLDQIEASLLLAVCYWKKKRGYQDTALEYLEQAVMLAQPFGYQQLFVSDGAELENMLSHLKRRTTRSDYRGKLSAPFVNKLYLKAAQQSAHSIGLTGGRTEQGIRFTAQQKRVMRLLCEGYSYRMAAEMLGIQYSTVRSHIELIYRKLDVSGVKEAVQKIQELNILQSE